MTERAHASAFILLCTAAWLALEINAQPAPPPPPVPSEAQPPASESGGKPAPGTTGCERCGTVETIRQAANQNQPIPLGTMPSVASGSSGLNPSSITAYQIGRDNQGQVTLGAAGGAVYQQNKPTQRVTRWEIVVRMDDGSARSVIQNYEPLLQVGDRVRVFGPQVELVQ